MAEITFDPTYGMYRDGERYLTRFEVQQEIQRLERYISRALTRDTRSFLAGELTIKLWQERMRDLIRMGHILGAVIGYGGDSQMSASRWGELGNRLRREYQSLNQFARQIESKQVIFESAILRRAKLYSTAIRVSYYKGETETAKKAGFTHSRRVLHAQETCTECREWSGRDFIPISDQPAIGTLKCRQFCRCTLEYR